MRGKLKPYGPFGLPVSIVIVTKLEHVEYFSRRFEQVDIVDGCVQATWRHRRLDAARGDYDLTIIQELDCDLSDIPREDWRIDWEKSVLPR